MAEPLTDEELITLESLYKAAIPLGSDWKADCTPVADGRPARIYEFGRVVAEFPQYLTPGGQFVHCQDARLVVAMVQTLPRLIDELRAARRLPSHA